MGLETYRVRKEFGWDGWLFAPSGNCRCPCSNNPHIVCTGEVGSGCVTCERSSCHCSCRIQPDRYGGDVWLVMEGHPRKETMLANRFAVADPSLPPATELVKQDEYERLLHLWQPNNVEIAPRRGRPPRVADPVA